ncbi:MAG: hypothetical protein RR475_12050 [Clostridia bacterium]
MHRPELIVMLTYHDVTVKNAKEIFLETQHSTADCWGFKIEGTTKESMFDLAQCIKNAGKKVFLEVLAIDEENCLTAAKYAAECGVDHLLGTMYFESVKNLTKKNGMRYSPFVSTDREILRGKMGNILKEASELEKEDLFGINLGGFRYVDGDPVQLMRSLSQILNKPMIVAGSIDSYKKIDFMKELPNVWGFTIGGAFFEKKFGITFLDQINIVNEYIKK